MARNKSDDIFRLIRSLTPEEKGYFKKFARRHSGEKNNLLELFDDINRQKVFDEDALNKKYRGYAMMKTRLFDAIVKSLWVSKNEANEHFEILQQIISSHILEEKGLLDKAQQSASKALDMARRLELFQYESLMIDRFFGLTRFSWEPKRIKPNAEKFFSDMQNARRKQENKEYFLKAHYVSYLQYLSTQNADPSIAYNFPVDLARLEDKNTAITPSNNRLRMAALIVHYQINEYYEKAYETALELFGMEKKMVLQKNRISDSYSRYITSLRILISLCHATGRIKEVEELLNTAWKAPASNEKEKLENTLFFIYKKALLYWDTGRHTEGEKFLSKNSEIILDSKLKTRYLYFVLDFIRLRILFQFSNQNYREAMLSIYDFESLNIKKHSPKYFKDCEFIKILIQADCGHYEQMENLINNLVRKSAQLHLDDTEKRFMNLLKRMNAYNKQRIYRQLYNQLSNSKHKIPLLWGFHLKDWTQTRIKKITFAEFLREQRT